MAKYPLHAFLQRCVSVQNAVWRFHALLAQGSLQSPMSPVYRPLHALTLPSEQTGLGSHGSALSVTFSCQELVLVAHLLAALLLK